MIASKKILFFCGSLEPGKSGVGDYTRKLAQELLRLHQIPSLILSLNDSYVDSKTISSCDESPLVEEIRLPKGSEHIWQEEINRILEEFHPDWVSLQYVGYSYDSRGCGYPITRLLRKLPKTIKLHIMFHELWEGFGIDDTVKAKVRGLIQKHSIKQLVSTLKPTVIHTQNAFYIAQLQRIGVQAHYLPLFGNIPIADEDSGHALSLIHKNGNITIKETDRSGYRIFVFFGSIYPSWPGEVLMDYMREAGSSLKKNMLFISIGRLGPQRRKWDSLCKDYGNHFAFAELGFLDATDISVLLQEADFGVATTPYEALGKSGSFVTMQEHGLPVFASRGMLRNKVSANHQEQEPNAYPIDSNTIPLVLDPPKRSAQKSRLPQTINSFVKDLNLL